MGRFSLLPDTVRTRISAECAELQLQLYACYSSWQPRYASFVWLVDSLDRLTDFAPGVRQVRADDSGGTYRAVYVAQFGESRLRASCLPEEGDLGACAAAKSH